MRRFLLHVLPSGLVRIRQFGFLANRFRTRNLQLCRDLLAVCQTPAPADSHNPADTNVPDRSSCPICKLGRLIIIEVIHPERAMVPDTFMTLARDLSSSSFYVPLRVSADLCLHVATPPVQGCYYRISGHPSLIFARIPSHDFNCAASSLQSVVFIGKTPFNTQ